MTDSLNEQLSACLDGQLPEAELDLLLKRVGRDTELRRTLGRYSLAGEALRGQGAARASSGFADRVAAAIAAEDVPARQGAAKANSALPRWLRPAAGLAVAASVAAVAVFSFQVPTLESTAIAIVAPQAPSVAAVGVTASDSYIVPANPVSNFIPAARLTNYVVAHSEYSSPLGRRTVLSGVLSEEDEPEAAALAEAGPAESGQTGRGQIGPQEAGKDTPGLQEPVPITDDEPAVGSAQR